MVIRLDSVWRGLSSRPGWVTVLCSRARLYPHTGLHQNGIQSNLNYLDLDYLNFFIFQTHFSGHYSVTFAILKANVMKLLLELNLFHFPELLNVIWGYSDQSPQVGVIKVWLYLRQLLTNLTNFFEGGQPTHLGGEATLLFASCYRNQDRPFMDGPLSLNADIKFNFLYLKLVFQVLKILLSLT